MTDNVKGELCLNNRRKCVRETSSNAIRASMISGIGRNVNEIFTLLGCYAA